MPIVVVAPDIAVNTDLVESVHYTEGTDDYLEKHVIINFKDYGHEIPPEYKLEEILAAMDGKCYYREEYNEMVGEIDICVIHKQNSQYNPGESGPYRKCLELSPWMTYERPEGDWFMLGHNTTHKPDISQSWEYRQKERKRLEAVAQEAFERDKDKPLSPVAEIMSNSAPIPPVITYNHPPKKKSWWARFTGVKDFNDEFPERN